MKIYRLRLNDSITRFVAVFLFLMDSNSSAANNKAALQVFKDQGELAVQYFTYQGNSNEKLYERGKVLTIRDNALNILNKYYSTVVSGKLGRLPELLNQQDGSRQRLVEFMKDVPDAFDSYTSLETVESEFSVRWGPYVVHSVTLSGKPGGFDWREATYCSSKHSGHCYISNFLDQLDGNKLLFIEAMQYYFDHSRHGLYSNTKEITKPTFQMFPDEAMAIFPGESHYPINVQIKLVKVDKPALNLGNYCKDESKQDFTDELLDFANAVCGLRNVSQTSQETLQAAFLQSGVTSSSSDMMPFNYYDVSSSKLGLANKEKNIKRVVIPVTDFLREIRKWDSLKVVAKVFNEAKGAVYIRPIQGSRLMPIQVFGLERLKDGSKVYLNASDMVSGFLTAEQLFRAIDAEDVDYVN